MGFGFGLIPVNRIIVELFKCYINGVKEFGATLVFQKEEKRGKNYGNQSADNFSAGDRRPDRNFNNLSLFFLAMGSLLSIEATFQSSIPLRQLDLPQRPRLNFNLDPKRARFPSQNGVKIYIRSDATILHHCEILQVCSRNESYLFFFSFFTLLSSIDARFGPNICSIV